MSLGGTNTEANLRQAFASESAANHRYLYFAQKADIEGYPEIAALFKTVADNETGHAFGHLEYLGAMGSGDPATGLSIELTTENLKSAIEHESFESSTMYPNFARIARDEGFVEIAEWFETLARGEKSNMARLQAVLDDLST